MENKETILLEKAQNGDAQAMFELGSYYFLLPRCEFEKAIHWYEKALEHGNNDAIYWLARVYEQIDIQRAARLQPNGEVVTYNLSIETINWYLKALEYYENNYQLKTEYAYQAGILLSDDEEAIRFDYEKAFNYFLYAADKEDESDIYTNLACAKVNQMYEEGLGTEVNLEKAKYYQEKYMRGLEVLMK